MNRLCPISTTIALAGIATFSGCDQTSEIAPPQILYGQQECEHCRMIISDERFAAGMVLDSADGTRASLGFDDVNCMFDYARERGGAHVMGWFVHDAVTRAWLSADQATFHISKTLPTPMASGVAAAASPEALADTAKEHPGEFVNFQTLKIRFTPDSAKPQGVTP